MEQKLQIFPQLCCGLPELVLYTVYFKTGDQLDAYPVSTKPCLFADGEERSLSVWPSLMYLCAPGLDLASSSPILFLDPSQSLPHTRAHTHTHTHFENSKYKYIALRERWGKESCGEKAHLVRIVKTIVNGRNKTVTFNG